MTALFFDTETTGIKSWKNPSFKPGLVQLGAILQDLDTKRVLAEVNLICLQPEGSRIPVEASAVHGISDQLAEAYGLDVRIIDAVFARLVTRADLVVAHNIAYDLDVVQDNMPLSAGVLTVRPGSEQDARPIFCTMVGNVYVVKAPLTANQVRYFSSKGELPEYPFKVPNLTETYKHYFGVPFEGAHDAMADIRACRDIFMQMLQRGYYVLRDGVPVPSEQLIEEVEAIHLKEAA